MVKCSFCNKPGIVEKNLIKGLNDNYICNDCVWLFLSDFSKLGYDISFFKDYYIEVKQKVDGRSIKISIERHVISTIPKYIAEEYKILPVSSHNYTLHVLISNFENVDKVKKVLNDITKVNIAFYKAPLSLIQKCIKEAYSKL